MEAHRLGRPQRLSGPAHAPSCVEATVSLPQLGGHWHCLETCSPCRGSLTTQGTPNSLRSTNPSAGDRIVVGSDHARRRRPGLVFAWLDVLVAQHGGDVPYRAGLDQGFPFRGNRVPFLNHQKGIYRAAAQRGPAALSIVTSFKSPYDDAEVPEGILYAYRAGPIDQPDNRALRAAHALQVPFVYFVATRPGWCRPLYPCFALADDVEARRVLITPGRMAGPVRRATSRASRG